MITQTDFEPFRLLLDQLCAAFDRPKAKDELVNAYWEALHEVRFAEVERRVKNILKTATSKTKWPKPGELREVAPDAADQGRSASMDAAYREAEMNNHRNWMAMKAADPELYQLEMGIAQCGRILARDHESSPQYAEAHRLDGHYRQRRRALLTERAKPCDAPA